jgi:hypothetical protein
MAFKRFSGPPLIRLMNQRMGATFFLRAGSAAGAARKRCNANPRGGGAKTRFAPSRPCVGAFPFYIKPIGCFRRRKTHVFGRCEVSTFASSALPPAAERGAEKPKKHEIASENNADGESCGRLATPQVPRATAL